MNEVATENLIWNRSLLGSDQKWFVEKPIIQLSISFANLPGGHAGDNGK